MSDTISEKVELGKKAHINKLETINESTTLKVGTTETIVQRRMPLGSRTTAFYVKVNFDSKKKKEAYRKINKRLEEG